MVASSEYEELGLRIVSERAEESGGRFSVQQDTRLLQRDIPLLAEVT